MATHNFSTYFTFSGCGTQLIVGMSCTLDTGVPFVGAPIKVVGIGETSFTFLSLPGHPEGADRLITFSFGTDSDGQTEMTVWSRGPGSLGASLTIATGIAFLFWHTYFDKLNMGILDGDIDNYEDSGGSGGGSFTVA